MNDSKNNVTVRKPIESGFKSEPDRYVLHLAKGLNLVAGQQLKIRFIA